MSEEIEQAYKYCEQVTRLNAKSFYFAAKFLPAVKQKAVYPIYAFCRHVDDEIDEIGEGDEVAAVRALEVWKTKLEEVYQRADNHSVNQTTESKPLSREQNLVFVAWQDLLANYKIPQKLPIELMEGVLMDTHVKRYETFSDLYVYCYRVASTVGLMSSEILGYRDAEALVYAEAMGIAMQLTNILRDIKEDANIGRIYLPKKDLEAFGVSEQQIFDGEIDENFVELMKFQINRAREYYREGEKGIPMLERDSRFTVLLASRIYGRILDEIERQHYDVFSKRASTSFSKKILSLPKIWRAARNL